MENSYLVVVHFFQIILRNCHSYEQICNDIENGISASGLLFDCQIPFDASDYDSIQDCIEEAAFQIESLPQPQSKIHFVNEFHDNMMIIGSISFDSCPTSSSYIIFLTPPPDVNIYIMPIAEKYQVSSSIAKDKLLTISNTSVVDSMVIWIHKNPQIFDKNGKEIKPDRWDILDEKKIVTLNDTLLLSTGVLDETLPLVNSSLEAKIPKRSEFMLNESFVSSMRSKKFCWDYNTTIAMLENYIDIKDKCSQDTKFKQVFAILCSQDSKLRELAEEPCSPDSKLHKLAEEQLKIFKVQTIKDKIHNLQKKYRQNKIKNRKIKYLITVSLY